MEANVTVAAAQAFDSLTENSFIDIIFTNTAGFTYAAGNIYYSALLTDSSEPAITQEVVFKETAAEGGTVAPGTSKTFTIENTNNLVPTVTGSEGRILYHSV